MHVFAGEAPPPGAYDPKFNNKVKGPVIEKTDRFLDTKSQCSSECGASAASAKSNNSTAIPFFRTVRIVLLIQTLNYKISLKQSFSCLIIIMR